MNRVVSEQDLQQRARELFGRSPTFLDLSPADLRRWSLSSALSQATVGAMGFRGSFEADCSHEIASRLGRSPVDSKTGFFVPEEVLFRPLTQRGLSVGSATGGGYLVATEASPLSFVDLVRARSVTRAMGAITLSGLVGDVTICKQSGSISVGWKTDEFTPAPEGTPTLGQIAMTPKTVTGFIQIGRTLALQSNPSAEAFAMRDLSASLSLAVDRAAISGPGAAGQPTGLLNTSGIGSVAGASIDFADIIELQSDVLTSGDDIDFSTVGSVATVPVAALLMQRVEFSGTSARLWQGALAEGTVLGARAMSSTQMASAAMAFGVWSDLIIGEWGVLEVQVDPYTAFRQGILGIRGMYSVDIAVRRPTSFSVATGIN